MLLFSQKFAWKLFFFFFGGGGEIQVRNDRLKKNNKYL